MSLVEPDKLLHEVYDTELGFRLTNFSVKPVHVANGLARALTQRSYDTQPLAETLRHWVRNQRLGVDEERFPNAVVLEEYGKAFTPLEGPKPNVKALGRLRALANDVLGADDAVYPQPDQSSYTLANERFVTRDPSDVRTGLFLARLLRAAPEDRTDAADLLLERLSSETDAWTTLALPLLELTTVREEKVPEIAAKSDHLFAASDGELALAIPRTLRDGLDRLARFERDGGSKLNSLRRLVLYGCFAVHVHAVSRWNGRDASAPRPPILLDMSDGSVRSVRDASRATVRAAGDAVEGLLLDRFAAWAQDEIGDDERSIRAALAAAEDASAVAKDFESQLGGGRPPLESLAQALVDAAFGKTREHPLGALVELGRRAGFLTPWSNAGAGGKLQKRYSATAEFLETLIAATIDPQDPLEFPEFLDRLRTDLGIVVGRADDDAIIRRNNLGDAQFGPPTAINEEDLRRNVERLRRLIVETGYGRSYADGRTIVTTTGQGGL